MRLSPWHSLSRWLLLLGLISLAGLGCGGPKTASVSGKVSYKGAPLKGGSVTFLSAADKKGITTPIGEDGAYTFDKLTTGEYKVGVETETMNNVPGTTGRTYGPPPGVKTDYKPPSGGGDGKARYVPIPGKYADPEKSGLSYTAKPGPQTNDIDLKD